MRLSVGQSTLLRFEAPQRRVLMSQRLTPADYKAQTLLEWDVTIPDAARGASFRDGSGDFTTTAGIDGPVEDVEITVTGTVETTDTMGVLSGLRERVPPAAYLRTTRATRPDKGLLDLARAGLADKATASLLDRAHALSAAVGEAIKHGADETEDGEAATASETLGRGAGSCRAQAHVLIALAIAQDIAARFIYGYVLTDAPSDGRDALVTDGGAPHAWAELHVGKLGWVGFDPVNACCPDDRYIRLCSGFDAQDAEPIRAFASGEAVDSATEIAVVVAAAGQVQQ